MVTPCVRLALAMIFLLSGGSIVWACPPGYKIFFNGFENVCLQCLAGEYSTTGMNEWCSTCDSGTYSQPAQAICCPYPTGAFEGELSCSNCTPGLTVDSGRCTVTCSAMTYCVDGYVYPCSTGTYSLAGSGACCGGGRQSVPGSRDCLICDANWYSNADTLGTCTQCPASKYAPMMSATCCSPGQTPSGTLCSNCTSGYYSNAYTNGACALCPVNTYSSAGASICCPPGGTPSQGTCAPCDAGTYSSAETKAVCMSCPAGTWSVPASSSCCPLGMSSSGGPSCENCTQNQYSSSDTQGYCYPCPLNKYAPAGSAVCCSPGSTPSGDTCVACSSGKYSNATTLSVCTNCPSGTYSPSGAFACCPPGMFFNISAPGGCSYCGANTYSNASTNGQCATCPAGTYSKQGSATCCTQGATPTGSTCTQCASGTFWSAANCINCSSSVYSPPGSLICCAPGYFPSGTSCLACGPGQYSNATSPGVCSPCPTGKYSSSASGICCAPGQRPSGTACAPCDAGYYSNATTSGECKPCSLGQNSTSGSSSCSICPPGLTTASSGSAVCSPCNSGDYSNVTTYGICTACAPGTFSSSGAYRCDQCEPGHISGARAAFCDPCQPGNYSNAATNNTCLKCAKGTYSDIGAPVCTVCAPGNTSIIEGSVNCTYQCPAGSFSSNSTKGLCELCTSGNYSLAGAGWCSPCPAGSKSTDGAAICCAPGFFATPGSFSCTPVTVQSIIIRMTGSRAVVATDLWEIKQAIIAKYGLVDSDLSVLLVTKRRAVVVVVETPIKVSFLTTEGLILYFRLMADVTAYSNFESFVKNSLGSEFYNGNTASPSQTPSSSGLSPSTSSSSSGSLGWVAGLVIGLLVVVALVAAILIYRYRQQHNQKPTKSPKNKNSVAMKRLDAPKSIYQTVDSLGTDHEQQRDDTSSVEILSKQKNLADLPPASTVIHSSDVHLELLLGEGSFAQVWRANWHGYTLAIKKLREDTLAVSPSEMFREASTMMLVPPHPNVVRIAGLCQEVGSFLIAMEFCPNGSLHGVIQKRIKQRHPLEDDEIENYLHDIAIGMRHLAEHGVIHRDLAARNVLLGEWNVPKISDFGMSRVVNGPQNAGKTQSNLGPIRWMAPESISHEYSQASDVWSFGCVALEMLLGEAPFDSQIPDLLEVANKVRSGEINPRTLLPAGRLPEWLRNILTRCWEFNAKDRPTFAEIVHVFEENKHVPISARVLEASDEHSATATI